MPVLLIANCIQHSQGSSSLGELRIASVIDAFRVVLLSTLAVVSQEDARRVQTTKYLFRESTSQLNKPWKGYEATPI